MGIGQKNKAGKKEIEGIEYRGIFVYGQIDMNIRGLYS